MEETRKFNCHLCGYTCSKSSDFDKHLETVKHLQKVLSNKKNNNNLFVCQCGKQYSHRQSLNKHKKKCNSLENKIDQILETNKILLMENEKIKKKLEEQPTQINNSFNLHLYLNETCKDAINLQDFISKIQIQSKDLERVLEEGLDYSVTNIFLQNLEKLEDEKRPIQCTDIKREIVYVKDEDVWQKDDDNKKIKSSIREMQDKHLKGITQWTTNNSDDTANHDPYIDLVSKVAADINVNAISKTIMKKTKIDKLGGN
tara:strand:+ start:9596 stop:10369 length:774 start_codon:yes stop_codon:yes gene_type:complete